MKKTILIKSIPALALSALVLSSCTQELDDPAGQNDHFGEATDVRPSPIAFSSLAFDATKGTDELPAAPLLCFFREAGDSIHTKTTLSGSTLYWASGDGIAVYEYLSGALKQSDRCTTTSTSTTGSFTPVTSAKQKNTSWITATGVPTESYDFYSYYPASASIATPSSGTVSLSNVAASQGGTLAGIGQYLICYGADSKTRAQIAAGTYPAFAFEPNVAIIHVTLTNSTGKALKGFQNFTVTADGSTGIVGAASLNLSTGVLTPSASTKAVSCSAAASDIANNGTKEYYFAVMPSASATKLSFSATAKNESNETYTLTMADYTLNGGIFGGYIYNISESVSGAALTATSVTITSSAATLWKGKTTTYAANITYAGGSAKSASSSDVSWSSNNTSVATVDANGVVTAVNPGEATITATSKVTGSVTGTQSVYVNVVNSLTFEPTSTKVKTNGGTVNITATVKLNNGNSQYGTPSVTINTSSSATSYVTVPSSYSVSSFSSGSGTATVVATGVSAGTATVTGTINNSNCPTVDGSNKTATCSVEALNEIALSTLKSMINNAEDCSSYLGWEVNSSGYAGPSVSGTKIGYIGYISTSDVDTGVSGSRILVLASSDASTEAQWGSNGTSRGAADGLVGYNNTNTLQGYGQSAHPAAYAAWNYSASIPSGGSNWFMPTKQQLSNIVSALGGYSTFKTKVGWSSARYWTSTEHNANAACLLLSDGTWSNSVYSGYGDPFKNRSFYVRACFAY